MNTLKEIIDYISSKKGTGFNEKDVEALSVAIEEFGDVRYQGGYDEGQISAVQSK